MKIGILGSGLMGGTLGVLLTRAAQTSYSALDQKLIAIEGQLVELRATGHGQDGVRWGAKHSRRPRDTWVTP
jgi:ketopantoate reductase